VAVGHRLGSIALPFTSIAAVLLQRSADAPATYLVVTGLVLHAVVIFLWSLICLQLARGFARRVFAACLVAACQFTLSWIIARSNGTGLASVLALGDRVVYAVVLAGALVVGMRFAFSQGTRPDRNVL
jgi:hypothetical protein